MNRKSGTENTNTECTANEKLMQKYIYEKWKKEKTNIKAIEKLNGKVKKLSRVKFYISV